jgi:uncharacterized membrane protein YphA (DoxX/SURF4 family)
MNLPFNIPIEVLYAGLGGTLLALFIAMWQQNWKLKVFFLLALRLAIGWHFLFEGLYKVHSHYTGPNDSTKAFTSEPYFKVAPGPIGGFMRKQFDDPNAVITARVMPGKEISHQAFAKLSLDEQAAACPASVSAALDAVKGLAVEAIKSAAVQEKNNAAADSAKALEAAKTDEDKQKIREEADNIRIVAEKKMADAEANAAKNIVAAKAAYARWVFGVDGRDTKVKVVTGDARLTAPQRLEHIAWLQKQIQSGDSQQSRSLGNGYGYDVKKNAEYRTDLIAAESDLAKDANAFVAELRASLTAGKAEPEPVEKKMGPMMDKITMWFLVAVGSGLLLGFICRLWCVLGAGFLVVTYLAHPAFPWFPQPPMTEGNPVFINKNIIECLALMSLACMPTGRWLGLDALILGVPRDPEVLPIQPMPVRTEPVPVRSMRPHGKI